MSDENPTVHVHRRAAVRPLTVADLVGRSYAEPHGCWDLARVVLARLGVALPANPAAALAAEGDLCRVVSDAPRAGDLLLLDGGGAQHVGVALNPFQFIHAARGAGTRIEQIDTWARARKVQRRVRFYELHPEPPATVGAG